MLELTALSLDLGEGIRHIIWYFMIGILLAGWIRTYKFHVRLRKRLPGFGGYAVLVAVAVSLVSPLCACGGLPIMVSLLTAGMPLAPCMALLVASPLMSIEGYVVIAGLLGTTRVNAKIIAAIFMGLYAGLDTNLFARRGFAVEEIFRGPIPQGDMHDHDCDPRIAGPLVEPRRTETPEQVHHLPGQVRANWLEGRPLHPHRCRDRGSRDPLHRP